MFVLSCIAALGIVVSVLCMMLTFAVLYEYHKTTIALNAVIGYLAKEIGVKETYLRTKIHELKRNI